VSIAGFGFDSWVRTVRGNLWRSVHFYALVIFNLNAALGALHCRRFLSRMEYPDTAVSIAVLLMAAVLYADYLMYSLYVKNREAVFGGSLENGAQNSVLAATYIAYRMYMLAIGAIGCCFQLISFSLR
jgi:hypothetical protein